MANLWERIKAYMSGWPIGKDDEPEPKKKPKGLNPKKKKSTHIIQHQLIPTHTI